MSTWPSVSSSSASPYGSHTHRRHAELARRAPSSISTPGERRVAVRVQQALLGGDERCRRRRRRSTRPRAPSAPSGRRCPACAAQRAGDRRVVVARRELVAPAVEHPVEGDARRRRRRSRRSARCRGTTSRRWRARRPRRRRRTLVPQRAARPGVGDHRHRLEAGDRAARPRRGRPGPRPSARRTARPRRPAHHGALVRAVSAGIRAGHRLMRRWASTPSSVSSGPYRSGRRSRNRPHACALRRAARRDRTSR